MGKADYMKLGDHNAISDRSGKKFKASEMRLQWNGLYVHKSEWEPRNEQDFLKGHPDNPQVPWTRPDSNADTNVVTVDGKSLVSNNFRDLRGDEDATLTVGISNGLQEWASPLTVDRTVGLSLAGVQSGDRFSIVRSVGGAFDLIIGSLKTVSIPSRTVVEFRRGVWDLESYTPSGL